MTDPSPGEPSPGAARRAIAIGALVAIGIAGLGGGGALLAVSLTHAASTGTAGGGSAATTRWQRLSAGQVFPATISYVNAQHITQSAHRVGIAPSASCRAGLDSAASATMAGLGCTMVLRATYADQSGTLLATVGVAVVASPSAAVTAVSRLAGLRTPAGVKAGAFSGTIANVFQDAQRAAFGTPVAAGRYVFFYTAGYADGRLGGSAGDNPDLDALGRGLVAQVGRVLAGQQPAPLADASRALALAEPAGTGMPAGAGAQISRELASAWQVSKGNGVTVAILDTGVASVNGLSGRVIAGPDYAPVASPVLTEGTVLASLIAGGGPGARTPNGAVGRAPAARILSIRIVAYGSDTQAALAYQRNGRWQPIEAEAIRYAADHGAKVIVCAESGSSSSPGLASAVAYAIAKNAVVITADFAFTRGNSAQYPDSLPGVINVSGTTVPGLPMTGPPGRFASNYSVLVTAPANDLFGTGPGNHVYIDYDNASAIAWTAGTVALIKSAYPRLSPALVARALAISASYHPPGGYDTRIGFGLINPIGAVHAAGQLAKLRATAAPGPGAVVPAVHFGAPGATGAQGAGGSRSGSSSAAAAVGYGAAVLVGLAAIGLAAALHRRRHGRGRGPERGGRDGLAKI